MNSKQLIAAGIVAAAVVANAAEMDPEQRGIKMLDGDRLTLNPYVSLSYTYDSNVDSARKSKSGSTWNVSPGISATYKDDNWDITGTLYYMYHAYNRYTSQLNSSSYGETLSLNWSNIAGGGKGWMFKLSESFSQIAQDDDMTNHGGRGVGRDRRQFQFSAMAERRINQWWHAGLTASYYLLDYDNNVNKYATLYGWKRLSVGAEAGYTATKWTDFILAANYMWYWQDNNDVRNVNLATTKSKRRISGDSKGWSLMGGVQTHMTEKISYRVLGGWSHFDYAGGTKKMNGPTYQVSGKWQIDAANTMSLMAMASSYYQPAESSYGSANKIDSFSVGFAKSFIRNKLRWTADLAYRRETREYAEINATSYNEDIWTGRLGLSYDINRLFTVFGSVEYQTESTTSNHGAGNAYDYDRWRGTVGVRMTY